MIWFWGKQDERLYEFGGILTSGKTSQEGSFLHNTIQLEALEYLKVAEFTVIEKNKKALFHSKKIQSDISLWIFCIKKLVVLVLFWKEG
ncbi:hypothetical protein [Peribacillus frigoritolerans]|uniref:hypothetical protein n=1 Tax=Peribacillus frigoritolerans TaxID=450367 RepID=UPI00380F134E